MLMFINEIKIVMMIIYQRSCLKLSSHSWTGALQDFVSALMPDTIIYVLKTIIVFHLSSRLVSTKIDVYHEPDPH